MNNESKIASLDAPPLHQYYVYLTAGCNLACQHCWIAPTYQPNGDTGGHLDLDLFELALGEGKPLGLQGVKLTGGEPFLHPDILKIIDLLRDRSLGLTIETNGTLLTPQIARYLKEKSTLNFISISLDGSNAASHDPFRGVKGSFDLACHGVHDLVEVGIHPQIIMSLHSTNVDEILPLIRMAEEMKASSVKFNLVQPSGRGNTMVKRGKVLTIERLLEIGHWVDNELQEKSSIPLFYSWPMAFYNLRRLLRIEGYSCSIYNILGLLPTGQVAMCGIGTIVPELCYGLLGKDRIEDIWKTHPKLLELRNGISAHLEGVCQTCILKNQCMGTCIAENYLLNNRLFAPYWFCQEAFEKGLFPPSRVMDVKTSGNNE